MLVKEMKEYCNWLTNCELSYEYEHLLFRVGAFWWKIKQILAFIYLQPSGLQT
jgi:hypothetical protein